MESDYEKLRRKNIEENHKMLRKLCLMTEFKDVQQPQKVFRQVKPKKSAPIKVVKPLSAVKESLCVGQLRRSNRLLNKSPSEDSIVSEKEEENIISNIPRIKENKFGAIEGIPVGTIFESRLEASRSGVHRPTVAGIHGNETEGCYSIALSGGYEDDIDLGNCFTYTGEGGRDLKGTKANPKNLRTAPQSKDQTLTRGNLALDLNVRNKKPVRVIRGYKLNSPYAPETGYRYDGLYTIHSRWSCIGLSGFIVFKYALERCDPEPAPWCDVEGGFPENSENRADNQSEKKECRDVEKE